VNEFPSIRLFLVRHAQARNAPGTSYDNASLSALGRMQGDAVARACAARRPSAVFASPAARATQTAALIAADASLRVAVDERLLEYRFGSIADPGLTLEQLRERRDDLLVWHPDRKLAADGETLRAFGLRVAAVLDEIVARHVGERLVIVAHAGSIDAALRWAIGIAPGTAVMHDFPIANASITELIHWPRGRVVGGAPRYTEFVSIGSVAHLPVACRSDN
jgi:probable phosphoglycerate mutase